MDEHTYNIFEEMKKAAKLFDIRHDTVWGKNGEWRRTEFILPDTVFFTYCAGVRSCMISEAEYQDSIYVRVYYGTIDDAAMCFDVFVNSIEEMKKVYDTLIRILHIDLDDHKHGPVALSYVDITGCNEYAELEIKFEEGVRKLLEKHLRPMCNYSVTFDYN
jgi:hypothetical protein